MQNNISPIVSDQAFKYLDETVCLFKLSAPIAPKAKVLCFPYAGGSGKVFTDLVSFLPPELEVWAIEAPGHLYTRGVPLENIETLCKAYLSSLSPEFFNLPLVLLGHSLGAYVACKFASLIAERNHEVYLILNGAQPPHLRSDTRKLSSLSLDELTQALILLHGIPESWATNPELLKLYETTLRADFKMYEDFIFPKNISHLHTLVINGFEDPLCPSYQAFEWREYFINLHIDFLNGGHLFINTHPSVVGKLVCNFLRNELPRIGRQHAVAMHQ